VLPENGLVVEHCVDHEQAESWDGVCVQERHWEQHSEFVVAQDCGESLKSNENSCCCKRLQKVVSAASIHKGVELLESEDVVDKLTESSPKQEVPSTDKGDLRDVQEVCHGSPAHQKQQTIQAKQSSFPISLRFFRIAVFFRQGWLLL